MSCRHSGTRIAGGIPDRFAPDEVRMSIVDATDASVALPQPEPARRVVGHSLLQRLIAGRGSPYAR